MPKTESQGFMKIIVVIVMALFALKLAGFDATAILDQMWFHDFSVWFKNTLAEVWKDIVEIFTYVVQAK